MCSTCSKAYGVNEESIMCCSIIILLTVCLNCLDFYQSLSLNLLQQSQAAAAGALRGAETNALLTSCPKISPLLL